MLFSKKRAAKPQRKVSVITHPILGEITVSQNSRARRIAISVRPPDKVRLSLPSSVPLSQAMRFLDERVEWIEQARQKIAKTHPAVIIEMPYSTRNHVLRLNPAYTDKIKVKVAKGEIIVTYPIERNYQEEEIQRAIKKGIEAGWRTEAKEMLPMRLEELSRKVGLKYNSICVRNTVSKWGSCSARNDISLSLHLMRLPNHLIDYIILHELCHIMHKNHGGEFHALLDRLTAGRHKELNKELKSWHTRW